MHKISSVFIVEPQNTGWIIERLMRDIAAELTARGIPAAIGKGSGYAGQEVIFNSRYLTALADPRARVNSLFITHVDDKIREMELRATFNRFNSFVCMSPHDAEFVTALKGGREGVIGIELPVRDQNVRPVRVGLFSARYADGRKNEQWILDFFASRSQEERNAFVLCFLGADWEEFTPRLAEIDLSYELYRYARSAAGEYERYKQVLGTLDVLIYPGFDGGAMSVYDAIGVGADVLASDISYHRGLGESVDLFQDQQAFNRALEDLLRKFQERASHLKDRAIGAYVDRLLRHWDSVTNGDSANAAPQPVTSTERASLETFRSHYKSSMSFGRIRSAMIRWLQARLIRH